MIWVLKIFIMIGEYFTLACVITNLEVLLEGLLVTDKIHLNVFHKTNDVLHVFGLLLTWFILIETLHLHLTLG